jgi:DNA-nicking Smr family endonuclease
MSRTGSDTPRPRRRLSSDEHKLWTGVTRSVTPLGRRRTPVAAATASEEPKPATARRRRTEPAAPSPQSPTKTPPVQLPMAPLGRRQKQRLARGSDEIDARLDLHGRTQSEAHVALLGFLRRAQHEGARFVLVITGKGDPTAHDFSSARGVLKRQVPMWLRLPEFRAFVLSVEDAHAAHGGGGALYIRLRRARS